MQRQQGVSLIELCCVLTIFALLTGMAAGRVSDWLERYRVDMAAGQLALDLRWLQQISINTVSDEVMPVLYFHNVPPFGYQIVGKDSAVIKAYTFPQQVVLGNSTDQVIFGSQGTPKSGSTETIIVQSASKRAINKKVVIEAITGRIRTE